MKHNTPRHKHTSGMTLLELTVVILVLLSLISILFVGARAWKKGSDRSANIINLRNCQQAMRGEQNMKRLLAGATFDQAALEEFMTFPQDVNSDVTYTAGTAITPDDDGAGDNMNHIWLVVSADGQPTGDYGHNSYDDIRGW